MKAFKEAMWLLDRLRVCVLSHEWAMANHYCEKIDEFKKEHPIANWFAKKLS